MYYTAPKPIAKIDHKEIPSIPDAIELEEESDSNHSDTSSEEDDNVQ